MTHVIATPVRSGTDRIGELIMALESLTETQGRDCARQLVQEILDLHGIGLFRMLDIIVDGNEAGHAILDKLAYDECVSALLLLHGLHPYDLAARVRQAIDGLRGIFGVQGIKIELIDVDEQVVRLRLSGRWHGKNVTAAGVRSDIEEAIFALAPEVALIEIDNLPDANVHEMKFVPASVLHGKHESTNR